MNKIKIWKPILETLNVKESNYEIFATYAEILNNNYSVVEFNENLLPVNLKALSKLDFDNINITLQESPNNISTLRFDRTINQVPENPEDSLLLVQKVEAELLDELADFLNTKKEISIYRLVNEISIQELLNGDITMFITSRVRTN